MKTGVQNYGYIFRPSRARHRNYELVARREGSPAHWYKSTERSPFGRACGTVRRPCHNEASATHVGAGFKPAPTTHLPPLQPDSENILPVGLATKRVGPEVLAYSVQPVLIANNSLEVVSLPNRCTGCPAHLIDAVPRTSSSLARSPTAARWVL